MHNAALATEVREQIAAAWAGEPESQRERHISRGEMLAHDRVGV